mmetsp:Transcript_80553/g.232834  ORF Transcript_80553/g.232834 Transcript_80553/m.232834 type:complete len:321 (+) Transcript_80553:432-1394(+)
MLLNGVAGAHLLGRRECAGAPGAAPEAGGGLRARRRGPGQDLRGKARTGSPGLPASPAAACLHSEPVDGRDLGLHVGAHRARDLRRRQLLRSRRRAGPVVRGGAGRDGLVFRNLHGDQGEHRGAAVPRQIVGACAESDALRGPDGAGIGGGGADLRRRGLRGRAGRGRRGRIGRGGPGDRRRRRGRCCRRGRHRARRVGGAIERQWPTVGLRCVLGRALGVEDACVPRDVAVCLEAQETRRGGRPHRGAARKEQETKEREEGRQGRQGGGRGSRPGHQHGWRGPGRARERRILGACGVRHRFWFPEPSGQDQAVVVRMPA